MPGPYSIDLRQRVINAYESKEGSQRQIAQRFQVSQSFVKKLIYRYRETGTVEPKSHGGGAIAIIKKSELKQVEQLVNEQQSCSTARIVRTLGSQKGNKSQHFYHAPQAREVEVNN